MRLRGRALSLRLVWVMGRKSRRLFRGSEERDNYDVEANGLTAATTAEHPGQPPSCDEERYRFRTLHSGHYGMKTEA